MQATRRQGGCAAPARCEPVSRLPRRDLRLLTWRRGRGAAVAVVFALLSGHLLNSAQASQQTEVKTLFLNPSAFFEREVRLRGQIRVVGAGESWFVLEDGTGRLLVTTVGLSSPTHCGQGARVALTGRLLSLGEEFGLYFALTRLDECSHETHPWTARLARWLGVRDTWPLLSSSAMIRP